MHAPVHIESSCTNESVSVSFPLLILLQREENLLTGCRTQNADQVSTAARALLLFKQTEPAMSELRPSSSLMQHVTSNHRGTSTVRARYEHSSVYHLTKITLFLLCRHICVSPLDRGDQGLSVCLRFWTREGRTKEEN